MESSVCGQDMNDMERKVHDFNHDFRNIQLMVMLTNRHLRLFSYSLHMNLVLERDGSISLNVVNMEALLSLGNPGGGNGPSGIVNINLGGFTNADRSLATTGSAGMIQNPTLTVLMGKFHCRY